MTKKTTRLAVKPAQKKKTTVAENFVVGAFGIRYPIGFQYKVTLPAELREVKWLIAEGVYTSIKEYEAETTRQLLAIK